MKLLFNGRGVQRRYVEKTRICIHFKENHDGFAAGLFKSGKDTFTSHSATGLCDLRKKNLASDTRDWRQTPETVQQSCSGPAQERQENIAEPLRNRDDVTLVRAESVPMISWPQFCVNLLKIVRDIQFHEHAYHEVTRPARIKIRFLERLWLACYSTSTPIFNIEEALHYEVT